MGDRCRCQRRLTVAGVCRQPAPSDVAVLPRCSLTRSPRYKLPENQQHRRFLRRSVRSAAVKRIPCKPHTSLMQAMHRMR